MLREFEAFLQDISQCFLERDVDRWKSRLALPFSIITKDGPVVLSTDAEVEQNFRHYLKAMEVLRLDMVDRVVVSLEDCKDGTWLGTFQTRLISDQILAVAPYTSTGLLQLDKGRFRMSSMLNARGHSEWTQAEGV